MSRPAELADRLDPVECIATLAQDLRISRESTGITGNISDDRCSGPGDFVCLLARAGTRRIKDHGLELVEIGAGHRTTEQVPMIGEDQAPRLPRRRLER